MINIWLVCFLSFEYNCGNDNEKGGRYKVNKLLYIWVPSENKAELFYHLVGKSVYSNQGEVQFADGYVKASDVRFDPNSTSLTPSNTAAEAEAAAQKK